MELPQPQAASGPQGRINTMHQIDDTDAPTLQCGGGPMRGTMMDFPSTLTAILERAQTVCKVKSCRGG
jgi:hypothetical protein